MRVTCSLCRQLTDVRTELSTRSTAMIVEDVHAIFSHRIREMLLIKITTQCRRSFYSPILSFHRMWEDGSRHTRPILSRGRKKTRGSTLTLITIITDWSLDIIFDRNFKLFVLLHFIMKSSATSPNLQQGKYFLLLCRFQTLIDGICSSQWYGRN